MTAVTGRAITGCRFCGGALSVPFCDLGTMPLANSYLPAGHAREPEPAFPLEVRVCGDCWLAQLSHVVDEKAIFSDYAYFSSFSREWLAHAAAYAGAMRERLALGPSSFVAEVASNDGYLLRNFVAAGIPCLGIEPAANVAAAAVAAGVPTEVAFFGRETAQRLVARRGHADLVAANNVLAHVPDVNDFVAGLSLLAGARGVVTIEAPHLLRLVGEAQFDTIYHEHYAYWSLHAMARVLRAHGLRVFDVERLATHGGSLRVFAAAASSPWCIPTARLDAVLQEERAAGVESAAYYAAFQPRVGAILEGARDWLARRRAAGETVAGYGAAAKGNTFLNALRAGAGDLLCVADRNPAKQGRLLPGSRIPVVSPRQLLERRPDVVLVLPWNLAREISQDLSAIGAWGGRFAVAIPAMREWAAA